MVFGLFRKKTSQPPLSETPLEQRQIRIGDQQLAFLQAGPTERTILFLHGNSSCKEAFAQQFQTAHDAGFGILAFDLPGHGASADAANPELDYTIPAYADLAAKLLASLNISRPLLCGWSLGGHIAIEMAGQSADYAGLMFFGTPPVGPGMEHVESAFLPSEVADVTGSADPPEDRLRAYIAAVYGTVSDVPNQLVQAGLRADGRSRTAMFSHWVGGSSGHNQRRVVAEWKRPLFIVHGEQDAFVSGNYIRSLALGGDGTDGVIQSMERVGHAPFLEDPKTFNASLLGFASRAFG